MAAKHWIGTVPKGDPEAQFWLNPNTLEHIEYIKLQEEKGHGNTAYEHFQVYLCLKEKKRLTWLKKHIHPRAHWEKKLGTVAEAIDYVSKEDTRVPGGITFEYGERPKEQNEAATEAAAANRIREKDDIQLQAQDILQQMNEGKFIPWSQIPADVQMKNGFLTAYKMACKDMVGPERPDLKIITLIGPPGCGKSYAISKLFPRAAKWLKGNSGDWFCNAKSDVLVFEEFSGQVPLQNMLKYLDPYPLALEVKGGTEPAMYRLVIITSNTSPDDWYTKAEEFKVQQTDDVYSVSTAKKRRIDALAALHDRLGFKPLTRTNGTCYIYTLDESLGNINLQIKSMREEIMEILQHAKLDLEKDTHDIQIPSPMPESQDPSDSIPEFEHEDLDETDPLPAAVAACSSDEDD